MARRKREPLNMAGMSGWLFADMLLVLAVVALGAMLASPESVAAYVTSVRGPAATPSPKPGSEMTLKPKPKPSPTKARPLALDKTPRRFELRFNTGALLAGDQSTIAEVDRQIRAATAKYAGSRAGFVLTFGGDSSPGTATQIATAVNLRLLAVRAAMFKGAVTRDYINLGLSDGAVVQVFLYT